MPSQTEPNGSVACQILMDVYEADRDSITLTWAHGR